MLRDGETYNGVVEGDGRWIESAKGTTGFQITIKSDEGDVTDFVIWLTQKTKDRAIESFGVLGVSEADLRRASYVENLAPGAVNGRPLSFKVALEEYKDKKQLKVKYIGKRRESLAGGSVAHAAVKFFSEGSDSPAARSPKYEEYPERVSNPLPDDDDIPF